MTGTKQYKCHICGKKLTSTDGYLSHLKKIHNLNIDEFINTCTEYDLSEAKCPICGKLRKFNIKGKQFVGKTCGNKDCTREIHIRSETEEVKRKRVEHARITCKKKYGVCSFVETQ